MRPFATCLLCLSLAARAEPPPVVQSELLPAAQAATPPPQAGATLRSRISDDTIRKAVKETLEARVPDCLHPDGLKRQPTFFLSGLFALPFVAVAKLRGKCN